MRALISGWLCLTVGFFGVLSFAAASDADVQAIVNLVSEANVTEYQHAIESSGLGLYAGPLFNQKTRGRAYTGFQGDKGNQEARKYLFDQLRGFGLNPAVQGKYYNVVAEQTGATSPQNVLIIAAHYDTIKSNVPGGDADAIGAAGVLEAARVLSAYKFDTTIRFIVFNTTTKHQVGSNDYLKNIAGIGTEKLVGVIYLDEILHPFHDKNPALPEALAVGVSSKTGAAGAWAAAFAAAAQQFVPGLALDASGPVLDLANDQFTFITYGYVASLRLSENSNKDIANSALGKPTDASDGTAGAHYDYTFASNVVRASVALIAQQAGFLGLNDSSAPTFPDSDGDGFSDDVETELGSDPALSASTPLNLPAATPAGLLETVTTVISLDFTAPSSDLMTIVGTIPVHAGFEPKDSVVIIDVAGAIKAITLKATGSGKIGANTFALKLKRTQGLVVEQSAQFTFTLGQGNFKRQFAPLGLTNFSFAGKPVTVPMSLYFAGEVRQTARILVYTSVRNQTGIAHN